MEQSERRERVNVQSLDPSGGDVDGGNDDEIGVDVEGGEGFEEDAYGDVELVVPGSAHIHHGGVSIPVVFCSGTAERCGEDEA